MGIANRGLRPPSLYELRRTPPPATFLGPVGAEKSGVAAIMVGALLDHLAVIATGDNNLR